MYLHLKNLDLLKIVLSKSGVEEYKNFSFSVKKTNSLKKLVRNIKIDDLSIKLFSIF